MSCNNLNLELIKSSTLASCQDQTARFSFVCRILVDAVFLHKITHSPLQTMPVQKNDLFSFGIRWGLETTQRSKTSVLTSMLKLRLPRLGISEYPTSFPVLLHIQVLRLFVANMPKYDKGTGKGRKFYAVRIGRNPVMQSKFN